MNKKIDLNLIQAKIMNAIFTLLSRRPTLKVTLVAMFFLLQFNFSPNASGQDGVFLLSDGLGTIATTIGSTSTNWAPSPFISSRKDYRVQFLYETEELFLAKDEGYSVITSLAFNIVGMSGINLNSYELQNISIKMGHTVATYDGYGLTNVWGTNKEKIP